MRRLIATVLRRLGTLRHLLGGFLDKGFPAEAPRVETILLIGAAQILWLEVPDHAAVDLSVRLAQADRRAARYAGLVNAVLRRVAQSRASIAGRSMLHVTRRNGCWRAGPSATAPTPRAPSRRPTATSRRSISPSNPMPRPGPSACAGACCRPERCAPSRTARSRCCRASTKAPGGCRTPPPRCRRACSATCAAKKSPICARRPAARPRSSPSPAPASPRSTARPPGSAALRENLARLALAAETVAADALEWQGGPFDAVLLDAPCSSTGTIRRHPDVPWLKSEADISVLAGLQRRLLDRAVELLKPGGTLVYCVCSLEPEEGEDQIAALLARDPRLARTPVAAPRSVRPARNS